MLLINATNLRQGGGLNVAVSMIVEFDFQTNKDVLFIINKLISSQIPNYILDKWFDRIYIVEKLNVFNISANIAKILRKNKSIKTVFSIFGPNYIYLPKTVKHVVGFANPWLIYDTKVVYQKLKISERIKKRVKYVIYDLVFKYGSDEFICETEDVANRVRRKYGKPTYVVENTYSNIFTEYLKYERKSPDLLNSPKIRILCLGWNYPHKNYDIVKDMIDRSCGDNLLKKVQYYFTMPDDQFEAFAHGYKNKVRNLGVVASSKLPSLYQKMDILFLPSFLECSSANIPEAMIMKVPLLLSNYTFNRSVARDFAFYFDATDADAAVKKLYEVISLSPTALDEILDQANKYVEHRVGDYKRGDLYLRILRDDQILN